MGIGVDIVSVRRIVEVLSRWDYKFLNRIFSQQEIMIANKKKGKVFFQHIAGRFAAKEAVLKLFDGEISFKDISIVRDPSGRPYAYVKGFSDRIDVSISHTEDYAVAVAVR